MISQDTKQKILDATRIEEVIGDFVSLKKRGANHIGCCPFHNEKTPSFYVSPTKGIFKCFGCGESGDAVSFLMKHEHYTYPEALKFLAEKYGIAVEEEVESEETKQKRSERDALFLVSEFAQKYFVNILNENEMGRAVGLAYYHERGLSDEIIKRFGLGYSLDEWDAFTKYALKNGFSKEVLDKTGLTVIREDGKMYDRFRGRVTFPIYSISGRVLGFSCRILSKEKQAAKYVNSPESEIYVKSKVLYGLYQAKNAISRQNKCYLVEGNIDVVSMHQSGVENTVAPCGTSLTEEQVRLIKRYTPNVTIVFDSDFAGIKATSRAANMLFEEGMRVRCVLFPEGDDPDSYAQRCGSQKLQEYLATHEENYLLYKARVTSDTIKNDPIGKAELVQDIVNTIALVPDLLERSEYIQQCANLFGMREDVLSTNVARAIMNAKHKQWKQEQNASQTNDPAQTSETQMSTDPQTAPSSPAQLIHTPTSRQPDLVEENPTESQERHVIDILIRFCEDAVNWTYKDAQNNDVCQRLNVASVIVSEIHIAKIKFSNPLYQKIFDESKALVMNHEKVKTDYFLNNTDEQIRDLTISLMMQPYELSELWLEKKEIATPSELQRLPSDLRFSLRNLRLKKVEAEIAENSRKMKNTIDDEQLDILLAERARLWKLKTEIGKSIDIVIS